MQPHSGLSLSSPALVFSLHLISIDLSTFAQAQGGFTIIKDKDSPGHDYDKAAGNSLEMCEIKCHLQFPQESLLFEKQVGVCLHRFSGRSIRQHGTLSH
jgi:hypothetical protein